MLLASTHVRQIQDSGSGFFANAQNPVITGGIFVVSFLAGCKTTNNISYLQEQ